MSEIFDLNEFSRINRSRCESPEGFNHPLDSWEYEQWTNARAGEAGEACNVSKKLLRHRQSIAGNKGDDLNVAALKRKLAGELADTMIYADLAIQRLGLNTADVLRDTFNNKSTELGCQIIVPAPKSAEGARTNLCACGEQWCPACMGTLDEYNAKTKQVLP